MSTTAILVGCGITTGLVGAALIKARTALASWLGVVGMTLGLAMIMVSGSSASPSDANGRIAIGASVGVSLLLSLYYRQQRQGRST